MDASPNAAELIQTNFGGLECLKRFGRRPAIAFEKISHHLQFSAMKQNFFWAGAFLAIVVAIFAQEPSQSPAAPDKTLSAPPR